jgi:hypothetical protein
MTEKSLKPISLIIPVLVALHSYFSYVFLSKYLAQFNLHKSNIISTEDILYLFGDANQVIICSAFSGFILVILARFSMSEETYNNINTFLIQDGKSFSKQAKVFFRSIKSKKKKVFILAVLYTIVLTSLTFITNKILKINSITSLGSFFIFLNLILPVMYIFWVPKRNLIIGVSFLLMLAFANKLIDASIHNANTNKTSKFIDLSFAYNGILGKEIVQTNRDTLRAVFEGYKFYILRNPINKKTYYYEPERISNIKRHIVE